MDNFYLLLAYGVGCAACALAGSFGSIGSAKGFVAGLFLTPVFGMCVVFASLIKDGNESLCDLLDALTEEVPADPEGDK